MRLWVLTFLTFLATAAAQQPVQFKVDADYIKVPVTVVDGSGRLLNTLTRDDFRLLDEGEARPIRNFVLAQAPVNVVFLLDVSGSLHEELREIKESTLRFARAFGPEDRFAVISFADKITVLQDWTNRRRKLKNSLKKLRPGYRTALWDALLDTARKTISKVGGRRVIILLTDGLDNESYAGYEEAIDELIKTDVSLYIVSRTRLVRPAVMQSNRVEFLNRVMKNVLKEDVDFVEIYFKEKETAMNHLAESTGGRVFFPKELIELRSSYAQVARELKNQYLLTFVPPDISQKRFRSIEVICNRDCGRVFHRRAYSWRGPLE